MNGKKAWIWIVLVAAVVGVLVAKNAGRHRPVPAPASPAVSEPATGESTNTVAAAIEPAGMVAIPRLVDLGAGKCIPCKMMAPILAELKQTYAGRMDVTFIDVWEQPDEAKKYGINLIPTQIFYDAQGQERFRHEGFYGREDILAKWKEFGVELEGVVE
jgi:thioredoxin 1